MKVEFFPRLKSSRRVLLGFQAALVLLGSSLLSALVQGDEHWAYAAIDTRITPPVTNDPRVLNPIDQFIFAQLRIHELTPNPSANLPNLFRRAAYDMTGLPPSPEWLQSSPPTSQQDYLRFIDRLLNSPRFGEHWGRRWLDLARYADTNGVDENYNYLQAWRYRDYVVKALNQDKPYNRFLTEQIAGDLLSPDVPWQKQADQIIATGFLTLGPKMLAEQDKEKLLIDIVDEQIDTLARTTMGMTIGCARCHDHKFDPVSKEDYYALAGIFASTKTMANTDHVSFWNESVIPHPDNAKLTRHHQQEIEERSDTIEALRRTADSEEKKKKLQQLEKELKKLRDQGPKLPKAMAVMEGQPHNIPVHIRGNHTTKGSQLIPRGFPQRVAQQMKSVSITPAQSGRRELAAWLTQPDHPLTARVMVNRIWQGYFGRGLVATPSNFGLRGSPPSHPLLLDWLAAELIRADWSLKHIHRLILTSATYQQSSQANEAARGIDPDNTLLSHQNQRRLSAESIRDSILLAADRLDLTMGGQVEQADQNATYYRGKGNEFHSRRRALYLPIIRGRGYEMFNTFDYPDSGSHLAQRTSTIVPHQALFMLNDPMVSESAATLAKTVSRDAHELTDAQMDHIYATLYFRRPSSIERQRVRRHLNQFSQTIEATPDESPVAALVHGLMAANEFIYVE